MNDRDVTNKRPPLHSSFYVFATIPPLPFARRSKKEMKSAFYITFQSISFREAHTFIVYGLRDSRVRFFGAPSPWLQAPLPLTALVAFAQANWKRYILAFPARTRASREWRGERRFMFCKASLIKMSLRNMEFVRCRCRCWYRKSVDEEGEKENQVQQKQYRFGWNAMSAREPERKTLKAEEETYSFVTS